VLQGRGTATLQLGDAIRARDTRASIQQLGQLQSTGDQLSDPLAAALASQLHDLSPANTQGADIDLRRRLEDDAVDRVYLSGAAIDAAADARPSEAEAYVSAAGQAADDFGNQLGAVYTSDVTTGLADRLRTETSDLASAAGGADRHQASSDVDRLRSQIDGELSGGNPLLAPGLIGEQLRASDRPLFSAVDAFVIRDYSTAYARLHESARAAEKAADTVGLGLVDRYPGRYLNLTATSTTVSSTRAELQQPPGLAAALDPTCGSPGARRAGSCLPADLGLASSRQLRGGVGRTQPRVGHR
jgi:hypothetical protein